MKIFSTDGYKYFSISYLYLILQIAATGTNFLLTPLMISRTDATQFKGWAIINALGQLMLLSDWGFLNRYRVDMTTYFEKAQKFPRELWSSVLKIMKFSSIFGFLIMTIIGLFSLKLMNYMTGEYALCLILALLSNFATLYEHVFLIKYQSINREDTILRILIVCRINEIALQVIVLLFSGKLIVLYASMLLSRILVLLLISTRKTIREIEIDVSEIKTQMRVFEDQDLSGIFFVISNLIYTNLLTLIVAKILPTNQFIIFQIARLIAAPTRMIGSALAIGTAQKDLRNSFEFSEHQDRNQIKETLAALSFLVSFGLFSSFFGPTIWNFFFPLNELERTTLIYMLVIQAVLDSFIWWKSKVYFNLKNALRLSIANLILSINGVLLTPIFFYQFGIDGIPCVLIIFDILLILMMSTRKSKKWLLP